MKYWSRSALATSVIAKEIVERYGGTIMPETCLTAAFADGGFQGGLAQGFGLSAIPVPTRSESAMPARCRKRLSTSR